MSSSKLLLAFLFLAFLVCADPPVAPAAEEGTEETSDPEALIQKMAESDWAGRHYHQELVKRGEPAVKPLIGALQHDTPRVRYWSVAALAKIGDDRVIDPIVDSLDDPHHLVRAVAAWHLRRWFNLPKVRGAVFQKLADENETVQTWAARAIKENGGLPEVKRAVLERMDDPSKQVRGWALEIVREKEYPEAIPRLKKYVDSEDLVRRYAAVRALPALIGEEAIPLLKNALRTDSSSEVRAAAVHGLARWFDRPPIRQIILDTLRDDDEYVRGWALSVVAEKGYRKALPRVRRLLKNEDPDIRYDAVRALVRIEGDEAIDALIKVLENDESPAVRECSIRSVTFMEPRVPRTAELLIMGLKDENEEVRAAAAELLRKGFDQFFGFRADETLGSRQTAIDNWQNWYDRHKDQLRWSEQKRRFEVAADEE